MSLIGVWELSNEGPKRIDESQVDFEKELEGWILRDPALVQAGLEIIAQQLVFDGGRCRLDLLALDTQGRWVVIEIKKEMLLRETITQVLDYTACLSTMSEEEVIEKINPRSIGKSQSLRELLSERDALDSLSPKNRELSMIIIGTGKVPGLDSMVSFLTERFSVPLSVITFNVFQSESGSQMLVRELNEPDIEKIVDVKKKQALTIDELINLASNNGIGDQFKRLIEVGTKYEFYPRLGKSSIMFAPPANRTRCLFTIWTTPGRQKVKTYIATSAFIEFFQLPSEKAKELLGEDGWRYMGDEEINKFSTTLSSILADKEETTYI